MCQRAKYWGGDREKGNSSSPPQGWGRKSSCLSQVSCQLERTGIQRIRCYRQRFLSSKQRLPGLNLQQLLFVTLPLQRVTGHIIGMKSKGAKPSAAPAVRCCLEGALSCRAPCSSSPSFTFGDTTFPCFFFRHLPHHEVNEHAEVCNKTACQIHGDCGTLLDQTLQQGCLTAHFPATWKTSAPWKESMEGAPCPVSKRMAGIVL